MSEQGPKGDRHYYANMSPFHPGAGSEGLVMLGKELWSAYKARRERRLLEKMDKFDPDVPRPKTIFERLRRKGV